MWRKQNRATDTKRNFTKEKLIVYSVGENVRKWVLAYIYWYEYKLLKPLKGQFVSIYEILKHAYSLVNPYL